MDGCHGKDVMGAPPRITALLLAATMTLAPIRPARAVVAEPALLFRICAWSLEFEGRLEFRGCLPAVCSLSIFEVHGENEPELTLFWLGANPFLFRIGGCGGVEPAADGTVAHRITWLLDLNPIYPAEGAIPS